MRISVTEAKSHLTDLVRRAEARDEIILIRHGQPAVRLAPIQPLADAKLRKALLDTVRASAARKATTGPNAARSQDSSMARMAFPDDRGRYVRADGGGGEAP